MSGTYGKEGWKGGGGSQGWGTTQFRIPVCKMMKLFQLFQYNSHTRSWNCLCQRYDLLCHIFFQTPASVKQHVRNSIVLTGATLFPHLAVRNILNNDRTFPNGAKITKLVRKEATRDGFTLQKETLPFSIYLYVSSLYIHCPENFQSRSASESEISLAT